MSSATPVNLASRPPHRSLAVPLTSGLRCSQLVPATDADLKDTEHGRQTTMRTGGSLALFLSGSELTCTGSCRLSGRSSCSCHYVPTASNALFRCLWPALESLLLPPLLPPLAGPRPRRPNAPSVAPSVSPSVSSSVSFLFLSSFPSSYLPIIQ